MRRSWFPILLVAALLGLLGVLAYFQYQWLGQISDGDRERMQRNLQADTARFAEDFNREIQGAYFNFQLNADGWRTKNWNEFNERYKFWREKTVYPDLIKGFYFVEFGANQAFSRYSSEKQAFEISAWPENLARVAPRLTAEGALQPVAEEIPALLMPVHDAPERVDRIFLRTNRALAAGDARILPEMAMPKKFGVLVIELDENVIKGRILPDLAKKYYSENESANYRLAVTDRENKAIFQTGQLTATDSTARLFELSADNFMFFSNREVLSAIQGERKSLVLSTSKVESRTTVSSGDANRNAEVGTVSQKTPETSENPASAPTPRVANGRFEIQMKGAENVAGEKPRVRVFETELPETSPWTLKVQHSAGSLEQFITDTRNRNLAVSFGILSLLGLSVVLIMLSAQRARLFAERQVDFVSSVSHEFRTPLAVIYSAGENLADGVAKEERQVSRYGNLIKAEGRKLSKMVEQILDFAGANSGKKKYDLRETGVGEIIENALAECRPLIEEKNFTVETEIAENLPAITADKIALTQALQNLVVNSIKYSADEKWLKISARNGGGKLKIAVEDRGIGISKSDLKHIFEPFYRAKAVVDEQIHGNGLGLSLVKKTIEAHRGEIRVESERGKGSKFTIHLPLNI